MASGFDNDVMYADNVDFSGGSPVSAKVTTDGQLLIGATASPNIRVNTLTAGTGIAITNGAGTISIATNGSEVANTITGDNGGALAPIASNWNILGQDSGAHQVMETSGTGSTLSIEDRTWLTPLVVDASTTVGTRGTYSTIASAIAAATSGQSIYIRPGTYTEDITLSAGVNLFGMTCDGITPSVTILGKVTASYTGTVTLSGICLRTNSDFCLVQSGANDCNLYIINCFVFANNNTAISVTNSNGGSLLYLAFCRGEIGSAGIAYFSKSGIGQLKIFHCWFQNSAGSSTASDVSGAGLDINYSEFSNSITNSGASAIIGRSFISNLTTSSTGTFALSDSSAGILTTAGTGTITCNRCGFSGDTSTAVSIGAGTTVVMSNCSISSSNASAIGGLGTLKYSGLAFNNTSSTISTTTQVPNVSSNDALQVKTPGAYPYTTVPQDGIILVDTSSARTIVPLASPTTGQRHVIKDSVGSAAANNITITPSGKNIDGAASYLVTTNYGSLTIVYNGTEWSVI